MNKDIQQMRENHEIGYEEIDNRIHNMCNDSKNTIESIDYGYDKKCYISTDTINKLKLDGRRVDETVIYGSVFRYYTIYFL